MDVRPVLRLGMVLLAATVGLLIYVQWRPEAAPAGAEGGRSRPEMLDGDRDVASVASVLSYRRVVRGQDVWAITADRQVDYVDGWTVWEGPRLTIFGGRSDSSDDDVQIAGDTMRTTGEAGDFAEVRLIGNVVVNLPGQGVFETRRVDYDAVTGVASNCHRNALQYSGLLIGSDCLHFQTAGDTRAGESLSAELLRMWGALTIAAAEGTESGLPPGLEGSARELRFRPGGNLVTLEGNPEMNFDEASIRARELVLDMGPEARELHQVRALGGARARIGAAASARRADERVLVGDEIAIDFGAGAVLERLLATSGGDAAGGDSDAGDARLRLPGQGTLSARRIELLPAGGGQEVLATGGVRWQGDAGGLRALETAELRLRVADGGLEQIEAEGGVEAELGAEGGETRRFAGPRLSMRWQAGEEMPAQAEWPEGVEVTLGERVVRAGAARLEDEAWVLDGDPRPRVEDADVSFAADRVDVAADAGVIASGSVEGRLGGRRLAAGAALFGDAASVDFRSGRATIREDGQMLLQEAVQVIWETQSLLTPSLRLDTEAGRLRATGGVDLSAMARPEAETPELVTVTARDLLVERETEEIHVAGSARMRLGESQIGAERMAVMVDELGSWSQVVAEGEVTLDRPDAEATGERLEYTVQSGDMLLLGSEERPATFVFDELEYRSPEALRVRWEGDDVIIESTEAGRTTTKVVRREGETDG